MNFDALRTLPGTTQEEFDRISKGIFALATDEQCACVHPDRHMCIAIRTDRSYEEAMEAYDECQCYCHEEEEEE